METIAEHAATHGWLITRQSTVAGLNRVTFTLENAPTTVITWWHDGRFHAANLYRDGDGIDPAASTGDSGVALLWLALHDGTEAAA